MKANTPERIYLNPDVVPQNQSGKFLFVNYSDTDESKCTIEYIRTDAFIKKAKKWFEKQNEWYDINDIKHCDMESFEDFEKYMRE